MADIATTIDRKTGDHAIDAEKVVSNNDQTSMELVKAGSDNADEAYAALRGHGDIVVDTATAKRLLRKIDRYILPTMSLIYGLNYLDRTTLSYSSVMGTTTDLNVHGDNYQWQLNCYFDYLRYKKSEQRTRTCTWFSFNGVAAIDGGSIAYGVAEGGEREHFAIEAWKVL